MNTNDSLDEYMKPIQEIFNSRDSKTNMLAQQVPSHHNTYKGKVPRNCTRKNRKSFKLRVAALAAALTVGGLGIAKGFCDNSDKIPDENEHVSNIAVQLDNSQKQEFLNLQNEFSSLSENSSSAEINEYAKDLHDFIDDTIKSQIVDTYNRESHSEASFVTVHRNSPDPTEPLNYIYVAYVNGDQTNYIFLRGNYIESAIDDIISLKGYDVYHDGYDILHEVSNNIFEIPNELEEKDLFFSFDSEKDQITSFEIQKEKDNSAPQNTTDDLDR